MPQNWDSCYPEPPPLSSKPVRGHIWYTRERDPPTSTAACLALRGRLPLQINHTRVRWMAHRVLAMLGPKDTHLEISGCHLRVTWELLLKIPLMGGRLFKQKQINLCSGPLNGIPGPGPGGAIFFFFSQMILLCGRAKHHRVDSASGSYPSPSLLPSFQMHPRRFLCLFSHQRFLGARK